MTIADVHARTQRDPQKTERFLRETLKALEPHTLGGSAKTNALTFLADESMLSLDASLSSAPLFGVPIVVKDNIHVAGMPTTCASKILEGYQPLFEATVVTRLKAAGAVIVGKANMDEFAMGSSSENSALGAVGNPRWPDRVPGGSSGGSAAIVATDLVPVALGSDTGGSVRQPAAFCEVVGYRPTYGTLSRYGLTAFASSFDSVGTLSLSSNDAAQVTRIMAGHDSLDSTSSQKDLSGWDDEVHLKSLRVAEIAEFQAHSKDMDAEIVEGIGSTSAFLKTQGATLGTVSVPLVDMTLPLYYILATGEASANLARYDGVRYGRRAEGKNVFSLIESSRDEGFGKEVKRRILTGAFVLSAGYFDDYYVQGLRVRRLISKQFDQAFSKADILISATSPTPPFKPGEKSADPIAMYLADAFTIAAAVVGIPAVSIPIGRDSKGLPRSIQLMAPRFADAKLLKLAQWIQSSMA